MKLTLILVLVTHLSCCTFGATVAKSNPGPFVEEVVTEAVTVPPEVVAKEVASEADYIIKYPTIPFPDEEVISNIPAPPDVDEVNPRMTEQQIVSGDADCSKLN